MSTVVIQTLFRAAIVGGLGWLLGREFDRPVELAIIGLLFFLVWLVRPYRRFLRWVEKGADQHMRDANYFWSAIQYPITKLIRQLNLQQEQLRADVDFFRDSFQALDSAVIVIDSDGYIIWSNQNAVALAGIDLERDAGRQLTSLFRSPRFIQFYESGEFSQPLLLSSPINSDIHLEVRATRYRRDDTLFFIRDASERVRLELMRQDFIANVSHELRTPLTVITGYLDMLKSSSENLPPIWGQTMDKMLVQSGRIDSMVTDLLWLSRLETVPAERDEQAVNLISLVESILSEARISAPSKQFQLLNDLDDPVQTQDALDATPESNQSLQPVVSVNGIYAELRSAFENLVQNAIKYTDEAAQIDVRIHIRGSELYVSFTDNGVGIEPVHIPRLTERFYRVDQSRATTTGGTGLGLAIVKHVLARHEARLIIQSELGKGSVFSCVFRDYLIEGRESAA